MKKGNDRERERESQNQKFVYLLKKDVLPLPHFCGFFIFGILAASAFGVLVAIQIYMCNGAFSPKQ